MAQNLRVEHRSDGVAVILIDVPGTAQNTLKASFKEELLDARREIAAKGARAIVIASNKEGSFLAGADIEMIKALGTREEAEERSREVQRAFGEIESSPIPFVAAIHGACLGGGLELALACRARVASDDPRTKLGLPEVQLGLLPGAGGTQRLPRLIGLEGALDLLLTGKQLDARRAWKKDLVDEVVPRAILVDAAARIALELAESHPRSVAERVSELADAKRLRELAVARNPAGRKLVFKQADRALRKKAGAHYPAPYRILAVVRAGLEKGFERGLEAEAKAFGELAMTDVSKRLIEIFFATTSLKKETGVKRADIRPREVQRVGVLGAGIMGRGIALVSAAQAGLDVRLKDRDTEALGQGLREIDKLLEEQVEKGRLDPRERDRQRLRISAATDYSGFVGCELVVEAVFEDLAIKHRVLEEVEAAVSPQTIFASNTSSIPITRIASVAKHKARVVGMHYFSPVQRMPLLEVIRTRETSDEAVATAVEVGKRQGKTVIVVNDGVGFYTSRVLGPYINEAAWLLSEGVPVEAIDEAAVDFGFPVGPITLLDEVGIDTAAKVSRIAAEAFGDRIASPGSLDRLIADGRTGRKGKKGFYTYDGKKKRVDESVYEVLGVRPEKKRSHDRQTLGERLALPLVAEAIRCLEEGVLESPRDGDIGAIFGIGFPPFKGGPFRFVDAAGAPRVLDRLTALEGRLGRRFAPPDLLVEHAQKKAPFYP